MTTRYGPNFSTHKISALDRHEKRRVQNIQRSVIVTSTDTRPPRDAPTAAPTFQRTDAPTAAPTNVPTDSPTDTPTLTSAPTADPHLSGLLPHRFPRNTVFPCPEWRQARCLLSVHQLVRKWQFSLLMVCLCKRVKCIELSSLRSYFERKNHIFEATKYFS